jgi:2-iminoacetate synthase
MMRHGAYLADRYPDCTLAFSLPRIHDAPDGFQVPYPVSNEELVRFYAALRCAFPEAVLVLSTREPAELRNQLARICITQMSAGSSTAPGGYRSDQAAAGEQFPVADDRSPAEVAEWLRRDGFQVRWSTR